LLETNRLVTVTGPSGSGKTQLALECAARYGMRFGEGAYVVDISTLGEAALIAPTIARLLRPGVPVDGTDAESLAQAVGERELLLVVDNCDRFVDPVAKVLGTFLFRCPNLRALATCSESLGVRDESTYPLGPMGSADALALFQLRAAGANNPVSAREVGGTPIAIEILAARASTEDLERIARFHVPPAQAAHSAIEWGYERGDADEQRVFRALAVFAGGFTLASGAELGTEPGARPEATAAIVARLERVALVSRTGGRYRLLEPARLFALERLHEAGEHERVTRRHAEVFDRLAQRACERLYDMTREAWRAPLEAELPNIRAALVWALDKRNDPKLGARIVGNLGSFWRDIGLPVEGLRRAQQAAAQGEGDGRLWLTIASIKSSLWILPREQLDAAERAYGLFEAAGDVRGQAESLVREGRAYAFMRKYDRAKRALHRAMQLAEGLALSRLTTQVAYEAAVAAAQCDDFEEAKRLYADIVPKLRDDGELRLSSVALSNLAEVEFATGDPGRAVACLDELSQLGTVGLDQAMFEANKTAYYVALDRRAEALATGRAALRLMRLSEDRVRIVFLLQHLAAAFALEGDLPRAARLYGYTGAQYVAFDIQLEFTERYTRDLLETALHDGLAGDEREALAHEGSLFSTERAAEEALRD
jgi:non-specific serine/threonine protein kinase